MAQQSIPVHRRYYNALLCYEKRGARPAVLAKIALTGAWALRVRYNVPISNDVIAGGIEELNDRISRHIKDGDSFELAKWTEVYSRIFAKREVKTDEAYLVAGLVTHGFLVRAGDHAGAEDVLKRLYERFDGVEPGKNANIEMLRGLVRERRESYRRYRTLLDLASTNFIAAMRQEEFSRPRLPEVLLVVAEALRRCDKLGDAAQWYLCLARMAETQPNLRAEIRAQGKAPGPEAPYHVQLGWIADRALARLIDKEVTVGDAPGGPNASMLNAVLSAGFGTPEYRNPAWTPITGADLKDCQMILDQVGKSLLDFQLRLGEWPASLDELWMRDVVRDRNLYNRFHCPISGKPLLYAAPPAKAEQRTVMIATPEPVPTPRGVRYIAYLANNTSAESEQPLTPGQVLAP